MSLFALHDLRRVPDSELADRLRRLRQRPPGDPEAVDYAYRRETWAMTTNIVEAEIRRRRIRGRHRHGPRAIATRAIVLAVVTAIATTLFGVAGLAATGVSLGAMWLVGQIRRNQRLTRYLKA
ncbi:hypothetical protein [Hamadaea tsunoensis]|uniref:hypothetical protein n=1 Tax=Hamadaea tsunoensis TaxID=53368 RepID=UPI0012F84478|nr:hypothetical protein [Hamadaea tsunoensis]